MPSAHALRVFRAALLAAAIVLTGCGGGGDGGNTGTSSTPQTSPPPASNSAPTIGGKPGTSVQVGQRYSFQPTASDPNGDELHFSASNLPSWATLDADSGRLTGQPSDGDVGTYSNIVITVSDGSASASLAAFSITVVAAAAASGSATLSWAAPTENTDGSALTDLTGYRIYYGTSADDLGMSVSIDNPSISTYVIENLTSGTWYFAMVATNSKGYDSSLSQVASKTIS